MNILIIGYGVVGKATHELLKYNNPDVAVDIYDTGIDAFKVLNADKQYDVSFICINLPNNGIGDDFNILVKAIRMVKSETYILRSTVVPFTTEKLRTMCNKDIIFMPEYLQEKTGFNKDMPILFSSHFNPPFREFFSVLFDKNQIQFFEAHILELSKHVQNSYFAYKITFFNAIREMCESLGVDYQDLKDCILRTARVTGTISETGMVTPCNGEYGYGGKCLPKDVLAMHKYAVINNLSLIEGIMAYVHNANQKFKEVNESINTGPNA